MDSSDVRTAFRKGEGFLIVDGFVIEGGALEIIFMTDYLSAGLG